VQRSGSKQNGFRVENVQNDRLGAICRKGRLWRWRPQDVEVDPRRSALMAGGAEQADRSHGQSGQVFIMV